MFNDGTFLDAHNMSMDNAEKVFIDQVEHRYSL